MSSRSKSSSSFTPKVVDYLYDNEHPDEHKNVVVNVGKGRLENLTGSAYLKMLEKHNERKKSRKPLAATERKYASSSSSKSRRSESSRSSTSNSSSNGLVKVPKRVVNETKRCTGRTKMLKRCRRYTTHKSQRCASHRK